jgi:phage terminase large subunit-like protein
MKTTVKDLIHQLEKQNPNETVFALIYTKDDVKELEHYDPDTDEIVNPYNDELAEKVLSSMDGYDVIYECIYNCMSDEVSYQVDQLSKQENITLEPASY